MDSEWLIINARGFASEDEAWQFGHRLKTAVEVSAVAARVGVDTGRNLATSGLGKIVKDALAQEGAHVRDNIHGLDVFPDHPNTRIFTMNATGIVKEKRLWVYQKLAAKEALPPTLPARKFVTGEGFPYLGRSYRLQLVAKLDVPVKLDAGRFRMRRDQTANGRATMIRWYTEHAQPWLAARVERYAGRARVKPSAVTVQDLGFRWGSCGRANRLYFHWRTILLPPRIVEYVVVHELVHLHQPHHTADFWRRVERAMPDFAERKQWLAENAHEAAAV